MSDIQSNSTTFAPVIRTQVPNLADYIAEQIINGTVLTDNLSDAETSLNTVINTYIALNSNINMPLYNISVDYETNKAEMMSILANAGTGSWQDTVIAGTGQTLLEMIAAALTYMQFNIIRSAQEVMMDTTTLINSIYAAVRHLGQRIARRQPGTCNVNLNNLSGVALSIPPYTAFSLGSNYYFNRSSIVFSSGTTLLSNVPLYEGQIYTTQFTSDGTGFQAFVFGNSDYTISDSDVIVNINSITWTPTTFAQYFNVGLWEYSSSSLVYSNYTTSDGNVELRFGNGIYGQVPPAGQSINVTYVSTNGVDGNLNLINSAVACNSNNSITGTVVSQTINGTDPLTPGSYKILGPGSYAAKYRASTRPDYKSIAVQYPGILDALFLFQQDFAPYDLSQMMLCKTVLLTNSSWSTSTYNSFTAWLSNLGIANMQYTNQPPIETSLNITATVYCLNNADYTSVSSNITAGLTSAFTFGLGTLGYIWSAYDIDKIISKADPDIDYIELTNPTSDVDTTPIITTSLSTSASSGTTLLNVASSTGISPGQIVTCTNAGGYVVNITSNTVTISAATSGTIASGTTVQFQFPLNYGYVNLNSITLDLLPSQRSPKAS